MLTTAALRQRFLQFFVDKHHSLVASGSLVPGNDPTLLFTNAGMVPFKDVFLGVEKRDYVRATSAQCCVRAGGKHNDLENVGYTARHHTFFEMLGNFSFGDYFKREAIQFAWQFLTDVLKIPAEKLWVTVYQDDDEAASIWLDEMQIDPSHFTRCGDADNFWSMGDTGPCGPCSEIFYDHGADIAGGPPGTPDADGDRYIEIWNMVFMQYQRFADGRLEPLPKPSVDTGMGLERITAVMQGVHDNYDIDIFQALIKAIADIGQVKDTQHKSLRVIADHIRSSSFLIADGVLPSNEGRGYVLRRIIRRAIRHGNQLGIEGAFFYRLVTPLAEQMGDAYPQLRQANIAEVLKQEEQQFATTLENGLKVLQQEIDKLTASNGTVIAGEVMFKLYDTYGFPVDLTGDIARERQLGMDIAGFEQAMQQQRQQSKQHNQFTHDYTQQITSDAQSEFTGYESLADEAMVIGLFKDQQSVTELAEGEAGVIILDSTPFYAEGGGQMGDQGELSNDHGHFQVQDTGKSGAAYLHHGTVKHGQITLNDRVQAHVDAKRRQAIILNHSATHLLHAVLRNELGEHVQQKGSLVAPTHLRFDFSHGKALSTSELQTIEYKVNQQIRANLAVAADTMSFDDAKAAGAMALFGEKYGDKVRVLRMGDFSVELCGGTHVQHSGDIGLFKITAESGIAAGVRRIEAVTGEAALDYVEQQQQQLQQLAQQLKCKPAQAQNKLQQLLSEHRQLQKNHQQLQREMLGQQGSDIANQAETIADTKVLLASLDNADSQQLRETVDQLKQQLGKAVIVLASSTPNKVSLIAGVTDNLTSTIKAGDLIKRVASGVGGKGGGRADMAQAGGTQPGKLPQAFRDAKQWLSEQLG